MGKRRKSMFDELEPQIRALRAAGMDCKEILEVIGPELYDYQSLYYFIKTRGIESAFQGCQKCKHYVTVKSLSRIENRPICLKYGLQLSGKKGRPKVCVMSDIKDICQNPAIEMI